MKVKIEARAKLSQRLPSFLDHIARLGRLARWLAISLQRGHVAGWPASAVLKKVVGAPTGRGSRLRAALQCGRSIDMKHDEQDLNRKLTCPLLALWGKTGAVQRYFDVLSVWRERAVNVNGKPVSGRHFLPEESPDEVLSELRAFLKP